MRAPLVMPAFGHLFPVCPATALSFAGVLGLAAIVTGLAAAFAFAGVLPFTGMLISLGSLVGFFAAVSGLGFVLIAAVLRHCREVCASSQASKGRAHQ